ncbi:membrane protein, partial [Streptomyces viridochromogenes]
MHTGGGALTLLNDEDDWSGSKDEEHGKDSK